MARYSAARRRIFAHVAWPMLILIALCFVFCCAGCGPDVSGMQEEGDVQGLLALLQGDDPTRAGGAADALRTLADPASVEPLIAIIEADPFSSAASYAVDILAAIGDTRAVPAIIGVLGTTPSVSERSRVERYEQPAAIAALGTLADPRAAQPIVDWVKENGPPLYVSGDEKAVVDDALLAIGVGAVDPLLALAADQEAPGAVRNWAVSVVGKIGDPVAAPALVELLADSALDRDKLASSLADLGPGAVEALLAGLGSEDWMVATYSATALGRIGDGRAEAALLAAMQTGESHVKLAASDALALIGRDNPAKLLEWLGAKDTVLIYYGLIHLGHPEMEAPLLEALERYGTKGMAEHYLNSGKAELSAAAKTWAEANGYDIMTFSNVPAAETGWGSLGDE